MVYIKKKHFFNLNQYSKYTKYIQVKLLIQFIFIWIKWLVNENVLLFFKNCQWILRLHNWSLMILLAFFSETTIQSFWILWSIIFVLIHVVLNEILISLETLAGINNKKANTFTISFLGIKYDVNKLKLRAKVEMICQQEEEEDKRNF